MIFTEGQILKGRKAVDAYRTAHTALHFKGWHKGIAEEHTPLLDKLLADLKEQGFNSLGEFFAASEKLNIQELGFGRVINFYSEIDRLRKIPDEAKTKELTNKLREKWR